MTIQSGKARFLEVGKLHGDGIQLEEVYVSIFL